MYISYTYTYLFDFCYSFENPDWVMFESITTVEQVVYIYIYAYIYIWHVHNSPRLFVLYSCNFWCIFENQYISVTFEITEIPILIGVVITIELKLFFWTFAFTIWLQFSTVLFSYTEQDMSGWIYGRIANRSIPV